MATIPEPPTKDPQFHFMKLPAEMRSMITGHVISERPHNLLEGIRLASKTLLKETDGDIDSEQLIHVSLDLHDIAPWLIAFGVNFVDVNNPSLPASGQRINGFLASGRCRMHLSMGWMIGPPQPTPPFIPLVGLITKRELQRLCLTLQQYTYQFTLFELQNQTRWNLTRENGGSNITGTFVGQPNTGIYCIIDLTAPALQALTPHSENLLLRPFRRLIYPAMSVHIAGSVHPNGSASLAAIMGPQAVSMISMAWHMLEEAKSVRQIIADNHRINRADDVIIGAGYFMSTWTAGILMHFGNFTMASFDQDTLLWPIAASSCIAMDCLTMSALQSMRTQRNEAHRDITRHDFFLQQFVLPKLRSMPSNITTNLLHSPNSQLHPHTEFKRAFYMALCAWEPSHANFDQLRDAIDRLLAIHPNRNHLRVEKAHTLSQTITSGQPINMLDADTVLDGMGLGAPEDVPCTIVAYEDRAPPLGLNGWN